MAGRNDQAIVKALEAMAQAIAHANAAQLEQQNQQGGADEFRLDLFMRNNPPTFKGRYDSEDAEVWLQEIERIFRAMACTDAQKVMLATHMLAEAASYWWGNTCQRLEAAGTLITWDGFKDEFLGKYFSACVRTKKEIEFLELKQGNMTVADYAAKFEGLSRFCPLYNTEGAEGSKCVKFESGLRPEIKQFIGYQQIRQFSVLVNKCRIYDEDNTARSNHYKAVNEKKNGDQNRSEYWWGNTRQRVEVAGTLTTWDDVNDEFLGKYFPADVRSKKEIEFLELKQGNMTVADYAAKFEELSRFCPPYNVVGAEGSKCVKFEIGLRPEIKQYVGYHEIRQFSVLVNKCRILDEDIRATSNHYKVVNDKKSRGQNRSKPYTTPKGNKILR